MSFLATWQGVGRNGSIFLLLYFFAASLIFLLLLHLVSAHLPTSSPLPLELFLITGELLESSRNRKGVRWNRNIFPELRCPRDPKKYLDVVELFHFF